MTATDAPPSPAREQDRKYGAADEDRQVQRINEEERNPTAADPRD
jgi:hypothetical protein